MTMHVFEITVQALGPDPIAPATTAPGAGKALYAAVDAAQDMLKAHGFTVAHTGYGVRPLKGE